MDVSCSTVAFGLAYVFLQQRVQRVRFHLILELTRVARQFDHLVPAFAVYQLKGTGRPFLASAGTGARRSTILSFGARVCGALASAGNGALRSTVVSGACLCSASAFANAGTGMRCSTT